MICNNCNNDISSESKYCRFCGEKLEKNNDELGQREVKNSEKVANKRDYWLGSVLVVFGFLSLILIVTFPADESSYDSFFNSPTPYVIDIIMGFFLLFHKRGLLKWIFVRYILGAIVTTLLAISASAYADILLNIPFFTYVFLLSRKEYISRLDLKIANYITIPAMFVFFIVYSLLVSY